MSVEITQPYIIHNIKTAYERGGMVEAQRQAIDWWFYHDTRVDVELALKSPNETWFNT